MRKVLKGLGVALLLLITLVVSAILGVWLFPGVVINDQSLRWAAPKQDVVKFDSGFERLHLRARKNGFNRLTLDVSISDGNDPLCFQAPSVGVAGCLNDFRVSLELRFAWPLSVKLSRLGPVVIRGPKLSYSPPSAEPQEEPAASPSAPFAFLSYLSSDFHLEVLHIELPAIAVALPDAWKFAVDLRTTGDRNSASTSRVYALRATGAGPKRENATLEADLEFPNPSAYRAKTKAVLVLADGIRAEATLTGEGKIDAGTGTWTGSARIARLSPMIKRLELDAIRLDYGDALKFDARALIEAQLGDQARRADSATRPVQLNPVLRLNAAIERPAVKAGESAEYSFHIDCDPFTEHEISIAGGVAGTYSEERGARDALDGLTLERMDFAIRAPRFSRTVRSLRFTSAAVPAPFNVLDGTAELRLGQSVKRTELGRLEIPIRFETRLASRTQRLNIEANAQIARRAQPSGLKLEGDVLLNEVKLELPGLDPLRPMPALATDSRIQRKPKENEAPASATPDGRPFFEADLKIRTTDRPITLLDRHFLPAALFRANLQIREETGMQGTVRSDPFSIELLNRRAELERFSIEWLPERDDPALNARIRVQRTDYTIYAEIAQNGDQRSIRLYSEPPLSESDIVSVLLFNQLASELEPEDAQSTQSTQSAIASRALGFFTVWALASTPIEAVSYNPTTQTYSAKVRLADGLSAVVGSDWESSQTVGLRKRIGRNWVISTQVRTQDGSQQSHESFLEWYRRF